MDPLSQGLPGEVAAGDTVETPNLGGLRFIVPEDRFIHQSPGFLFIQQPGLAEILLVRPGTGPVTQGTDRLRLPECLSASGMETGWKGSGLLPATNRLAAS